MSCNQDNLKGPSSKLTTAISSQEFSNYMASLAPFERNPVVAVAVSGGIDSLCLTLLLQKWVQEQQGHLIALTVDHGLRPESSEEALQVAKWLSLHNIEHHILSWQGSKPKTRVQENARKARYKLLEDWCKKHNILHLCLGHQADDQVETFLFRLCRGSGIDGLAGMSAIVEKAEVRILRPLLKIKRERLQQTLLNLKQEWIEDPSNLDDHYTRTRLRYIQKTLEGEGLTLESLSKTIQKLSLSRAALEDQTTALLANSFQIFSSGYGILDLPQLLEAPDDIIMRVLSVSLTCLSGSTYPPRRIYLERLKNSIIPGIKVKGRTCWGCSIIPWRGKLLILRELSAISDQVLIDNSNNIVKWDNRFRFVFKQNLSKTVILQKLGINGWVQIVGQQPNLQKKLIPARVRPTLPALWQGDKVVAVPHLEYYGAPEILSSEDIGQWIFLPTHSLCNQFFTVG
ncbi:MAG: tRNA lysidine(34) synthetase TilS [Alphaproteobacteria bacterium]|nr:tRNA lysidine(34) synthetase TilS [Alphaproteobacteria bacterium]